MRDLKENFDTTIREVRKKLGSEMVLLLNNKMMPKVEVLPTGSYVLDDVLGIGGLPKGRVIEIYGPESSGKTTLALMMVSRTQQDGGLCAFIDTEHSVDIEHAKRLGINLESLVLSQPTTGEEAFELIEVLSRTGNVDLIVLDSVAALLPEAELNGEIRDQSIGLQARLMSKALRKITGLLNKSKTTLLFINQVRDKVGVIFGNPEITSGGRALKFYSSVRLEIRRGAQIQRLGEVVGSQIKIKVVKNKLAVPFKSCVLDVDFKDGISKEADLLLVAEKYKVVEKNGSWFAFEEENLAQGRANLIAKLREDNNLFERLKEKTLETMKRGLEDELTKVKTLEVVEREDLEKPEKSEDTSEQDSQTEGLFSDEL